MSGHLGESDHSGRGALPHILILDITDFFISAGMQSEHGQLRVW